MLVAITGWSRAKALLHPVIAIGMSDQKTEASERMDGIGRQRKFSCSNSELSAQHAAKKDFQTCKTWWLAAGWSKPSVVSDCSNAVWGRRGGVGL